MIDQEWLENLDFVRPDGLHIKGLAGVGSEKVVLNATTPDGERLVLATYLHVLGYHIRKIPMIIIAVVRWPGRKNRMPFLRKASPRSLEMKPIIEAGLA